MQTSSVRFGSIFKAVVPPNDPLFKTPEAISMAFLAAVANEEFQGDLGQATTQSTLYSKILLGMPLQKVRWQLLPNTWVENFQVR